jgi:hypothetical protein
MIMKMIKSTLILFAICICNVALAQSQSKTESDTTAAYFNKLLKSGKVTFGLKGGFTYGNLYGSETDYIFADSKTTYLPSFHAGIVVNSQVGKYFWLKHELLVNQRGAGVILNDSINGKFNSQIKMLYLDLFPISPTFHIKGFQIFTGPYVSLLTNATIKRKDQNGNEYSDRSIFGDPKNFEEENKYLQKFDFGIHAGLEYQFPFGLFIGAKYMHGFTDIFQYANSYTLDDPKTDRIKIYNHALMFSIGYAGNKVIKTGTDTSRNKKRSKNMNH